LYVANFLSAPLLVVASNPFVPDLFKEKSLANANGLRLIAINLAQITGCILLLLNSTGLSMFSSDVMYFLVAILLAVSLLYIPFHMKDVIIENKQKINYTD